MSSYTPSDISISSTFKKKWTSISSSTDGQYIIACAYDDYIYLSKDTGKNWTPLLTPGASKQYWSSVTISEDGEKLAACIFNGSIIISKNSGASWTTVDKLGLKKWTGITSSSDGKILAACVENEYFYASRDSGESWERIGTIGNWYAIDSSNDGNSLAVCNYGGKVYKTIWIKSENIFNKFVWRTLLVTDSNQNWSGVTISGDGTKIFACVNDGYIYDVSSTSSYKQICSNEQKLKWSGIKIISTGSTKVAACVNGGNIYYTDNTTTSTTWTVLGNNSSLSYKSITSSDNGTYIYSCATNNYIWYSENLGTTWSQQQNTPYEYGPVVLSRDTNARNIALCTVNGYIYKSLDQGKTYVACINSGKRNWSGIAASDDNTKLAACDYGGYIYTSYDSGFTWLDRKLDGTKNWLTIASSSNGNLLAASDSNIEASGGKLYVSSDSGMNWFDRSDTVPGPYYSIRIKTNTIYIVIKKLGNAQANVSLSTNSGKNWLRSTILPNNSSSNIWKGLAVASDGSKKVNGNYNGNLYYSPIASTTTSTVGATQTDAPLLAWTSVDSGNDGKIVGACASNTSKVYISTNYGADSWESVGIESNWGCISSSINGCQMVASSSSVVYLFKHKVDGVVCRTGSLIIEFTYDNTNVTEFICIPGQLVTAILESGGYAYQAIFVIFQNLTNFSYDDSIFDDIKLSLAAFFASQAYAQAYTQIVENLTTLFVDGKITISEYNNELEVSAKLLASQYPEWYFNNLTKIEEAMFELKYILIE